MIFKEKFQRYGYKGICHIIFFKIIYKLLNIQVFNCYKLPSQQIQSNEYIDFKKRYHAGFLEQSQLLKMLRPDEMTMDDHFVKNAFNKGDKCYGIIDGNNLVHYSWYSTKITPVADNYNFRFPKHLVYMYNAYTDKRYRGKKLYRYAVTQATRFFSGTGTDGSVTIISADNFSSIKAMKEIGFIFIGKFIICPVFGCFSFTPKKCKKIKIFLISDDDK